MYEAAFHLTKRPFGATPDATCFFAPEPIQEVLAELGHRVERGQGICILSGEAGVGKTLLCRRLASEQNEQFTVAFLSTSSFATRRSMLQAILYEIGQRYTGLGEQELRLELFSYLKRLSAEHKSLLLIVDEAHLLSERLLEELRILANLAEAGHAPVRLMLSGQPILEEILAAPAQTAFSQLIACQLLLEPLTIQQSRDYIEHRIRWAEGDLSSIFTSDAVDAVARASNGIPRCLNQLSDHSLLLAFIDESVAVESRHVADALADLKQLPLHWNEPLPVHSADEPENADEPPPDIILSPPGDDSAPCRAAGSRAYSIEIGGSDDDESFAPNTDGHTPLEEDEFNVTSTDLETDVSPYFIDDSFDAFTSEPAWRSAGVVPLSTGSRRAVHVVEEEVVIDRYAQIDSGNIRFDGTLPAPAPCGGRSAPTSSESEPAADSSKALRSPTDASEEQVLSLISLAQADGEEYRLAADVESAQPFDALRCRAEEEVLEETIATDLFELCQEVRAVKFNRSTVDDETVGDDAAPDSSVSERLQYDTGFGPKFDVVEFDTIETSHADQAFAEHSESTYALDTGCHPSSDSTDESPFDLPQQDYVEEEPAAIDEFDVVEPASPAVVETKTALRSTPTQFDPSLCDERLQKIDQGQQIPKPNYKLIFSTLRKKLAERR